MPKEKTLDFKAIVVHSNGRSEIKDFGGLVDVCKEIGFKTTKTLIKEDSWETMECGIEGVGIVAHDQDLKAHLPLNRLDIKGSFAIVGMKRDYDSKGNTRGTMFYGLTEEQANDTRLSLSLTTLKNLQTRWNDEEDEEF